MRELTLPYGASSLTFRLPERNLLAVVEPADVPAVPDPAAALRAAVRRPVGAAPLAGEPMPTGDQGCSGWTLAQPGLNAHQVMV